MFFLLEATAEAGRYKTEIEEANKAQEGLAKMQTDFAALDSEFQIVCGGLVIFAQTWQYVCNSLIFITYLFRLTQAISVPC